VTSYRSHVFDVRNLPIPTRRHAPIIANTDMRMLCRNSRKLGCRSSKYGQWLRRVGILCATWREAVQGIFIPAAASLDNERQTMGRWSWHDLLRIGSVLDVVTGHECARNLIFQTFFNPLHSCLDFTQSKEQLLSIFLSHFIRVFACLIFRSSYPPSQSFPPELISKSISINRCC
jgi:hypothetical protein